MRIFLIVSILLLLTASGSAAQEAPAVITGRVTVLDSLPASAGVLVRIESANVGVQTDSSGWYRLVVPARRITGDSIDLWAARIPLYPERRRIRLTPGREIRVDIDMKVNRLEQLPPCAHIVSGSRPRVESVKLCDVTRRVGQWASHR